MGCFLAILISLPAYQSVGSPSETADAAAIALASTIEATISAVEPISIEVTPSATSPAVETPTLEPTITASPTITVTPSPTPKPSLTASPAATENSGSTDPAPIMYYTQAGDTLPVLAIRFGVETSEIQSTKELPETGLLDPNQLLLIPNRLGETSETTQLIPDSELVYSPSAANFDIDGYVQDAGGYLSTYQEYLGSSGWNTGAELVHKVALDNSINPRILLALIEYQSHWVSGQPQSLSETHYPMGYFDNQQQDLRKQLNWAVDQLSIGYYSWRDGSLTSLTFPNGESLRLAPELNAGTVAVQYLFAQLYNQDDWAGALYDTESIATVFENLFGNPWLTAQTVEPLLPATLTQPELELPFIPNQIWSFSGGPHAAWNSQGARAALDFAPASMESGCVESNTWATAVATGLVVRSEKGIVVLDLDGDGSEQTGWVILYLHVATKGRAVEAGDWVSTGELIGHPSCEGGNATGTHIHIARKYNGEWVLADGPLPFMMSGWTAHAGEAAYKGTMTNGDQTVTANTVGSIDTNIVRRVEENDEG